MPRNVRNFWIEARIDGRESKIATGPERKDGGFELVVKMRDAGAVAVAGTLKGYADLNGELRLTWHAEPQWHGSRVPDVRTLLAESERDHA